MTAVILSALESSSPRAEHGITVIEEQGAEQRIAYTALAEQALAVSAALGALGVQRNDLVILALPAGIEHLVLLAGCVLAGALPCTVAPPGRSLTDGSRTLYQACETFNARLLIASPGHSAALQTLMAPLSTRVYSTDEIHCAAAAGLPPQVRRCEAGSGHHVQLTSGSTGRPKAVLLSHRNVIANVRGIGGAVGYDPARGDASACWLPMYHDMGLVTLLSNLYYQAPLLLLQPSSFIRNPLGWLKRMASFGATTTATPTFGLQYCIRRYRQTSMQGVDLSLLRNIFVGAERVDATCLRDFFNTFAPHGLAPTALQPCYGMAESTLAVTMQQATAPAEERSDTGPRVDCVDTTALREHGQARWAPGPGPQGETVLSMGRPIAGMQVRISPPGQAPADDREIGEIFIRGSSVMTGYLSDPAPTRAESDWLATGDLGYLVDEQLFVLGRKKELIIIRGSNYFPHEIEDMVGFCLQQHGDHCAAVAIGIHDQMQGTENLLLFIEHEQHELHAQLRSQLNAHLREQLGFSAHAILFVPVGKLPRTSSGKLQRLKCRELYINQTFQAADGVPATPVC